MANQISALVGTRIVAFSLGHPGLGPRRTSATLGQERWGAWGVSRNGVWRAQRTILDECWRPSLARSLVPKLHGLTRDLAGYLADYSKQRAHTRRLTAGRTPMRPWPEHGS